MEKIKKIAEDIYLSLGKGRSESTLHKAFEVGLRAAGVSYDTQVPIIIQYLGQPVGIERADILVQNSIVVELKAVKRLKEDDRHQLQRYMRDLKRETGVLINFGDELEIKELK